MNVNNILNKYKNLYECADEDDDSLDNSEICLISKEKLHDKFSIQLPCGHKFNYKELYAEIIYQKYKNPNIMLLPNQFICPYCRKMYDKLIPYYEIDGHCISKINNCTSKKILPILPCSWKYSAGPKKGCLCTNSACRFKIGDYCVTHYKAMMKRIEKQNEKKMEDVNVVMDSSCCGAILKYGKNKGTQCSRKCLENSKYCKMHEKMYKKKDI